MITFAIPALITPVASEPTFPFTATQVIDWRGLCRLYVMEGVEPDEQLRSFSGVGTQTPCRNLWCIWSTGAVSAEDGLMMHCCGSVVQDVVLYDPLWFLQTDRNLKGRRFCGTTSDDRAAMECVFCRKDIQRGCRFWLMGCGFVIEAVPICGCM
ncbi:MAG: hypothetical protein U0787_19090 [Polyangia bacterium]